MKKIIILLCFIGLPFWAAAQWSVDLAGEAGFAVETLSQTKQAGPGQPEEPYFNSGAAGYSFYGGIETGHFFTSRIGISTGMGFFYAKSPNDDNTYPDNPDWRSVSVKVPFSMLLALGSGNRSTLRFGLSAHINLLQKSPDYESLKTYTYQPVYWSVHAGYFYRPAKRFQVGIMLSRDITYFLKETEEGVGINGGTETVNLFTRHYFFTARLSVRYRLVGHRHK